MMMLLSVSVRTGSSRVKSWSKLFTSLLVFWKRNIGGFKRLSPRAVNVLVDFGLWT